MVETVNTSKSDAPAAGIPPQNPPQLPRGTSARKQRKGRKRRRGMIVIIVVVVLAAAAIIAALTGNREQGTTVEVQQAAHRTIVQTVSATGVIEPQTLVKISSEASGEIIFLGVKEGDVVQQGQVLVRLNPQSMTAQVDEARAAILAAQARQAQAEASLLRTEADLARVKQLSDKKLATPQELDASQTAARVAAAERDAARYGVQQAQAGLRSMQNAVSKTTIVAPISGVVTKLNSKLGEKVVGAIQMTGTEIMTIADMSVIESVVEVSETDVVQVKLGDKAEIEVDAIPDQKYDAYVTSIANSPKQTISQGAQDQVTNFEVRLRFVSPDVRFRPGMTATAVIKTATRANVLSVPIGAVTSRQPKDTVRQEMKKEAEENEGATDVKLEEARRDRPQPIVFVKQGDSVVVRPVKTGIRDDQYFEILEGLRTSDVVVSGPYRAVSKELEAGSKVKVIKKEKGGTNERSGDK